jgi:hypothetical protein
MVPQSPSSSPLSLFKSLVTGGVANCRHTHNQSKHIENKVLVIYGYMSYLVGGFNYIEKYESQLGWLFPYIWKNKHVWNHQPDIISPASPHVCRLTPILVGLECSTHRVGCAGRRTETASSTWGWRWTRNRRCASSGSRRHLISRSRPFCVYYDCYGYIYCYNIYIYNHFINYH